MPLPRSIPPFDKPMRLHPLLFCPDLPPDTIMPGVVCQDMNGMYPTQSGAAMLPSLVAVASPLPSPPLAAFFAETTQGAVSIYAATATNIYRLTLTGWVSVGSGYTATEWSFAQAGDDTIATDGVDLVQVNSPSSTPYATPGLAGTFGALGGGPPIAKYVIAVDPGAGISTVVFLFNLTTDQTGWVASSPGNDALWDDNVNDLSASGFLRAGQGPITGAATLRTYAVAFKATSLYIGAFIGAPFVWDWQVVSLQVGCESNQAIVNTQDLLVFPGSDDFYQFDGANLYPIQNSLRQWFFGDGAGAPGIANPNYIGSIVGRYDPNTSVVFWHFSSVNASPAGALDMYICWNRKSGGWGVGHTNGSGSAGAVQAAVVPDYGIGGWTYDQFAAFYGTYGNISGTITYGAALFNPSPSNAQAIFVGNQLYTYTGTPTSGYFQTGDLGDPTGMRLMRINRAQGLYGFNGFPTSATMNVYSRANTGQSPYTVRKTGVPISAVGNFDFQSTDYYQSLEFIFGSYAELQRIVIETVDAGSR